MLIRESPGVRGLAYVTVVFGCQTVFGRILAGGCCYCWVWGCVYEDAKALD